MCSHAWKNSKFYAYANVAGPITAEIIGAAGAFDVAVNGKLIEIKDCIELDKIRIFAWS